MEIVKDILNGDKKAIAKAISTIENFKPEACYILKALREYCGKSHIVGVTGPLGIGKSTLIDKLISIYRKSKCSIAVIAIDPTSPFTGGALLGDRVRMQRHSLDDGVFIRSMATRGGYGGIARALGPAIRILEAAGFNTIIIESVGAGQLDVNIANYSHTVLLVLGPMLGDEIQFMKSGIMEVADIYVINKSDNPNAELVAMMLVELLKYRKHEEGWIPPVVKTIGLTGIGVEELYHQIQIHKDFLYKTDTFTKLNRKRFMSELTDNVLYELNMIIKEKLYKDLEIGKIVESYMRSEITSYNATKQIIRLISKMLHSS
ncbi:MAG: methylmalonyl Co-A mutase-associated GTPase MeaB [Candidatus Methanomethylicia archaeon]